MVCNFNIKTHENNGALLIKWCVSCACTLVKMVCNLHVTHM